MHLLRAALPSSPSLAQWFLFLTPLCLLFPSPLQRQQVVFNCLTSYWVPRLSSLTIFPASSCSFWNAPSNFSCINAFGAGGTYYDICGAQSTPKGVSSLTTPCRSCKSNSALSSGLVANTFSHWWSHCICHSDHRAVSLKIPTWLNSFLA